MKKIENENIRKGYKRKYVNLVIGIFIIILAIGCSIYTYLEIDKVNKKIVYLDDLIVSEQVIDNKINKKVSLEVKSVPYEFAVNDSTSSSYYIVNDGKFMYVVFMSPSDFKKLNYEDIVKNSKKIEGISADVPLEVKRLAVEAYNESVKNDSDKISISNYNDYFGDVCLDMTKSDTIFAPIPYTMSLLLWIFGTIIFVSVLYEYIGYVGKVNKLNDDELNDLNRELNDSNAVFFKKSKIYLTDSYLIDLGSTFKMYKYEDILWVYRHEQRTNGIKSQSSLRVVTSDGKNRMLAAVNPFSKKSREEQIDLLNALMARDSNIRIGYTPENCAEMNLKFKEIKKQKRK